MREYITNKLQEKGFTLENDTLTKEVTQQAPGRRMVINGQLYNEPSQEVTTKFEIELLGDGYIEEPHENLIWVNWRVFHGEEKFVDYTEGLYDDDKNKFDEICNELGI